MKTKTLSRALLIKKLEKLAKNIKEEIISSQAFEYIYEDWKSKEQIMEEHLEMCSKIEEQNITGEEGSYIWDNWYARGQEDCASMLLTLIKQL